MKKLLIPLIAIAALAPLAGCVAPYYDTYGGGERYAPYGDGYDRYGYGDNGYGSGYGYAPAYGYGGYAYGGGYGGYYPDVSIGVRGRGWSARGRF